MHIVTVDIHVGTVLENSASACELILLTQMSYVWAKLFLSGKQKFVNTKSRFDHLVPRRHKIVCVFLATKATLFFFCLRTRVSLFLEIHLCVDMCLTFVFRPRNSNNLIQYVQFLHWFLFFCCCYLLFFVSFKISSLWIKGGGVERGSYVIRIQLCFEIIIINKNNYPLQKSFKWTII